MIAEYLNNLADKMAATSALGGTSPHSPDVGLNREELLRDVLNRHLPRRMEALLGGVTVALNGMRSKQIDIIVRADNAPRFEEQSRSFIPVESLVAAISVKSKLDKAGLTDALENLGSIPQLDASAFQFRQLRGLAQNSFLQRHPTTHIYGFAGYSTVEGCVEAIHEFFRTHPDFPQNRIPREIVVHGKYLITYSPFSGVTTNGASIPEKTFWPSTLGVGHRGLPLARVVNHMYSYLSWMPYLEIEFHSYINAAYGLAGDV